MFWKSISVLQNIKTCGVGNYCKKGFNDISFVDKKRYDKYLSCRK
jgi:hypothetical protein